MCYPIWFLITGSLMGNSELKSNLAVILGKNSKDYVNILLFPLLPTLKNYVYVLFDDAEFFVVFWNSVKIVFGVLVGQLMISVPCAWFLAKKRTLLNRIIVIVYIALMLLPFQVIMLPEYLILKKLNILNTLWSIILPGVFSPFPVFILYNFFRKVSNSIIDAVKIDGANEFETFFYIGVPLGKSGIISMLILEFLEYWNLVEQPMIFLESKKMWPISIYLPNINMENVGAVFAQSVLVLILPLLMFVWGQDYLKEGIALSVEK